MALDDLMDSLGAEDYLSNGSLDNLGDYLKGSYEIYDDGEFEDQPALRDLLIGLLSGEYSPEDAAAGLYAGPADDISQFEDGSPYGLLEGDLQRLAGLHKANDTDGVTVLDTDGNGDDDTAVASGDTPDEVRDNVEKARDKLTDDEYDSEDEDDWSDGEEDDLSSFDDDDEEDDDVTMSDEKEKEKKKDNGKKKEGKGCVSDETMKNILGALQDLRF